MSPAPLLAMKFSIVIPSFNQGTYLEACLESLLQQSGQDTELIVVDGGSHDQSIQVIRRHAERLSWWCSEPDQGQSDALCKGFRQARGECQAPSISCAPSWAVIRKRNGWWEAAA
jgi:glycosyltransferase involved in cell wall biosynthesis